MNLFEREAWGCIDGRKVWFLRLNPSAFRRSNYTIGCPNVREDQRLDALLTHALDIDFFQSDDRARRILRAFCDAGVTLPLVCETDFCPEELLRRVDDLTLCLCNLLTHVANAWNWG